MHLSSAVAALPLALAAALAASLAAAADPAPPPPQPRLTREELVRQWDLNSDGKIDVGEAEVASSRMRRERAEMRLQGGIDPVTGLPRSAQADENEPDEDAGKPITAEDLFGPDKKPLSAGATGASPATDWTKDAAPKATPPSVGPPRFGLPRNAGRQDARFAPLTGGVRAGAPAARPGYGSKMPVAPLNAGRSLDAIAPPPGMAGVAGSGQQLPGQAAGVRGGLLPTPRTAPAPRPVRRSQDPYDPY